MPQIYPTNEVPNTYMHKKEWGMNETKYVRTANCGVKSEPARRKRCIRLYFMLALIP
jgi:hypothetical protein